MLHCCTIIMGHLKVSLSPKSDTSCAITVPTRSPRAPNVVCHPAPDDHPNTSCTGCGCVCVCSGCAVGTYYCLQNAWEAHSGHQGSSQSTGIVDTSSDEGIRRSRLQTRVRFTQIRASAVGWYRRRWSSSRIVVGERVNSARTACPEA